MSGEAVSDWRTFVARSQGRVIMHCERLLTCPELPPGDRARLLRLIEQSSAQTDIEHRNFFREAS
jgi:hypothetical protein